MRFVPALSESDRKQLTALFKYHDSHSVRRRSHAILLSADGFTIAEIARIYQIHRDTVGTTFDRWKRDGIAGLFDDPRSGRPPKLSNEEADEAVKLLKEEPRSIKKALAATKEKTGQEISEWTLKRIAKNAQLRWKRMRKSVKGKRDQAEFERAQEEITTLHEQEAAGEVDLYYFDESGFSLTPEVPYAWQAVGETIEIPSSRSKRLNVLGFCNKQQDFHATTVQGYVESEVVIACFDQFCDTINKKTIVVVDNASMHTSGKFKGKLGEWEENGLTVKYLPTYSPELNLIEIVWRFIKYNWLPLSAYLSFKNLKIELQKVLDGIGSEYQITFA
jgi:transposase